MNAHLLLIAALALSGHASAATQARPTPPVAAFRALGANPAFRAAVLERLQDVQAGQLPAVSESAGPQSMETQAALFVRGLVADPEMVNAHLGAFTKHLGHENAQVVLKAHSSVVELARKGARIDPADASALANLYSRQFDQSAAAGAAAVPVLAADAGKKAVVTLQPANLPPLMSEAELKAYVEKNKTVSPMEFVTVDFKTETYRDEYEPMLKSMGVDRVIIETPSPAELTRHQDGEGWMAQTRYIRWTVEMPKPVVGLSASEAYLNAMKGKSADKFRGRLLSSAHLKVETVKLSKENYAQWYPLYDADVVLRNHKRNAMPDLAEKAAEDGTLKNWWGVFYRDPATNEVVGGVIILEKPERNMLIGGYAAYKKPESKPWDMSVRSFFASMDLAGKLGYPIWSMGQDTNMFGLDYTLGLPGNKAVFGAVPNVEDELLLSKVINSRKFAENKTPMGKSAGYMNFAVKRDSPLIARYVEDFQATKGAPRGMHELLGGYYTPASLKPEQVLRAVHHRGDDESGFKVPNGLTLEKRKMSTEGAR